MCRSRDGGYQRIVRKIYFYFFQDIETSLLYYPFVKGTHRSTVDSHHKQPAVRRFMFSLLLAWTSFWISNRVTGDSRRHDVHVIIPTTCAIGFSDSFPYACNPRPTSRSICIRDQIIGLSFVLYSLPKSRQAGNITGIQRSPLIIPRTDNKPFNIFVAFRFGCVPCLNSGLFYVTYYTDGLVQDCSNSSVC